MRLLSDTEQTLLTDKINRYARCSAERREAIRFDNEAGLYRHLNTLRRANSRKFHSLAVLELMWARVARAFLRLYPVSN